MREPWTGALALAVLAMTGSPAAADCTKLAEDANRALREEPLSVLADIQKRAMAEPSCDARFRERLDRSIALAFTRAAQKEANEEQRELKLREALTHGRPWQTLALVADLKRKNRAFADAAGLYLEALDQADDPRMTPEIKALLQQKAAETRLLVPDDQLGRLFRCGQVATPDAVTTRGCLGDSTILPIRFSPGSDELPAAAKLLLKEVLSSLVASGSPALLVIGHADADGSALSNQELSLRRAEAVRARLAENGYQGEIKVEGHGSSDRFKPSEAEFFTPEELKQMDRRVEIRVSTTAPTPQEPAR